MAIRSWFGLRRSIFVLALTVLAIVSVVWRRPHQRPTPVPPAQENAGPVANRDLGHEASELPKSNPDQSVPSGPANNASWRPGAVESPQATPDPVPGGTPQLPVVRVTLGDPSAQGEHVISVPLKGCMIMIQIPAPNPTYQGYAAILKPAHGGKPLRLKAIDNQDGKFITLYFSSSGIANGEHILTVLGRLDAGRSEKLGDYTLEIRRD